MCVVGGRIKPRDGSGDTNPGLFPEMEPGDWSGSHLDDLFAKSGGHGCGRIIFVDEKTSGCDAPSHNSRPNCGL